MKNLLSAVSILSIIILSAGSALVGAGTMVYNFYLGTPILNGFIVFCLGSILFISIIIAYMVSKVMTSTTVMVDVLENLLNNEIEKKTDNTNPFSSLLNGLGASITSIKIGKIDEDGNITSIGDQSVSGLEEVMKNLNLNVNPITEKKLEDMTIKELQGELDKDIAKQSYERAAKIRDLIQEKKNNKS